MPNMMSILIIAGVILIALIAMALIFAKLYKRATKEISFVRTGLGGQKVVMNGGALVLPVFHELIPVNMNTLRLEVQRNNEQALITRDRMRVDVAAEFYVRAKPTEEAIASAAQTLGLKTMNPEQLKELVEGKFVDALRAVAAEMAMEELHEQRVDFVQKVQQVVTEDLLKNGLELETVSLTGLDQTSKKHFNPDNAFDAEGLTKLTEKIEERRKKRNDIEQDTEVAIANKNLEAERQKLEIIKEEEYAKLKQEREIEIRRAAQMSEIAMEQAEKKREAEQSQIEAKKNVDMSSILAERSVEEERIDKDKLLKEKEILKERAIESSEIEKKKTLELAEQDRAIAIAQKSKEQSEAQADADRARAVAVKEEEAVTTVRETEIAERAKSVELVKARENAEREAIKIKIAAETEKISAMDHAEAVRTTANAKADEQRIKAQGEADAEKLKADAAAKRYAVDAEGRRAINEAHNILSDQQIAMQVRMGLIKNLPDIIKESVKPMENIDGIKIIHVDGLAAGNNGTSNEESTVQGGGQCLSDQLVNSALRYRGQAPLIDSLMEEIGIKAGDINGFTAGLKDQDPPN
ncbi:flotillin family protein [Desulfobacula toluolica]|uniref:YqiK: predicted inner membrane protein n=1 Tax=Desulfobacula toluolica (strain DSM 7467 / Tol2) TaxID=651182 RepID=K0NGY8_DESTT|nr:flotillin family protein [Desulfobacula toluolica]CCK79108.1 YqiK: predicted inner membrane protein [Desulfobacula toluolica Tol2]